MTDAPDLLTRLQALNPAHDDDPPPPAYARTRARIGQTRGARPRARRVVAWAAPGAAAILAVSLVVTSGPSRTVHAPALGVLQTAQAVAAADPAGARFSGYVAETVDDNHLPGDPPHLTRTWLAIHQRSATEFDGSMESVIRPLTSEEQRMADANDKAGLQTDATVTQRRVGRDTHLVFSWVRPYGTIFNGALAPGQRPIPVPTDPGATAAAVAVWATGRTPAGDPQVADLLDEAVGHGHGTQLAFAYAQLVLTAPRVSPDVRAAVYQALQHVPGVRIDPHATDPAGRPAAALITDTDRGPVHTQAQLLIDPGTARVLATRSVSTVAPAANAHRAPDQPPYGEGSSQTTYRYDGKG